MNIVRNLRRRVIWLAYLRRVGRRWAWTLATNDVWPLKDISTEPDGSLMMWGLGSKIPEPNGSAMYVLHNIPQSFTLHQRFNATFAFEPDKVKVTMDGMTLSAHSEVDFRIISEIFGEQTYGLDLDGPIRVLDFGMNIGMASLYFARYFDSEVRSFELVPSTAAIAAENLKQNPELAKKIQLNVMGVSDKNGEMELAVNPDYRPSNSLFEKVPDSGKTETVHFRDVAEIFAEAEEGLGARALVVKLDAEGAEYEIMDRLAALGKVGVPEVWMIEWHTREGKNPESIRKILREAGFHWFERTHPEAPVGYITAFHKR